MKQIILTIVAFAALGLALPPLPPSPAVDMEKRDPAGEKPAPVTLEAIRANRFSKVSTARRRPPRRRPGPGRPPRPGPRPGPRRSPRPIPQRPPQRPPRLCPQRPPRRPPRRQPRPRPKRNPVGEKSAPVILEPRANRSSKPVEDKQPLRLLRTVMETEERGSVLYL